MSMDKEAFGLWGIRRFLLSSRERMYGNMCRSPAPDVIREEF